MHFEKDILISYAHIDDESLVEGDKGWIENFHRSLEIRLSQLMGDKPKIWRDPKLTGNDFFGDEIVDQFPNIALLVSILSPRYIKSEWCTREVNEFIKACQSNIGLRVKNKSRIFKVIKTPVNIEEHPEPIKGLLGYEFFKIDPQSGRPIEFNKMFGTENEVAYWSKLNDVAHDITELLKSLKSESTSSLSKDVAVDPEKKLSVYLAETSYDLNEYRENIKRELQEHNVVIYPDRSLPLVSGEFKDVVKQMAEKCDLSVHIIGNNYGIVPEGTDKSTVALQNETITALSKNLKISRLFWIPPDLAPEDPRQVKFIDEIQNSTEIQNGADILECSLEDLKYTIHKYLKDIKEARMKPALVDPPDVKSSISPDLPKMIYLICDQQDLEHTGELEDILFDQGFEVILPVFDGDESQIRLDHQENLKSCDAVLLYYGAGNELWMRSKIRELIKIAGYGREEPLEVKGVILAGPEEEYKKRIRAHDTMIIDCFNGISADKILPFISKVNQLKT